MRGRPPRLALAVLAVLSVLTTLLTTVLTTGPAPAAAPQRSEVASQPVGAARSATRVTVVNHNIERRPSALSAALTRAHRSGATMLTLQEVCWWQARDLAEAHPDWTIAWMRDGTSMRCRPTRGFDVLTQGDRGDSGLVVARIGGRGTTSRQVFKRQYRHQRAGLACVHWSEQRSRVHLCTTHLVNLGRRNYYRLRQVQLAQAREIRARTARWTRQGDLVVVTGDLNATPNSRTLDEIYRLDGVGRFNEATTCPALVLVCRRSRAATYDGLQAKLDYVFFSANRMVTGRPHGIVVVPTLSDHHLLQASAYVDLRTRSRALASR